MVKLSYVKLIKIISRFYHVCSGGRSRSYKNRGGFFKVSVNVKKG